MRKSMELRMQKRNKVLKTKIKWMWFSINWKMIQYNERRSMSKRPKMCKRARTEWQCHKKAQTTDSCTHEDMMEG